jgi:glycosyltransferase involved in cell wall biosynthesis
MATHATHSGCTLSLSMIVKNEEKFLDGCLLSVRGSVDEIVVVDTGSTDATKEIAERHGAKVFDFAWNDDFSAARNYALEQCAGKWILYLDADERLAEGQSALLRRLISSSDVGAYNVVIENPHSLKQGDFRQENAYPRLFRRVPGVRFEGKVHEQIWPSLLQQKLVVKQSALVLHHLGYSQGYDMVRQKAERNLGLLRLQLAEHPDDAYAAFQVGNSLVVLQRYDEAEPVLMQVVAHDGLDRTNRASAFNLLAEIAVKRGRLADAVQYCIKSVQLAPRQVMAHWFLSLLYFDLKEYSKAVDALTSVERLLQLPAVQRSNQLASDLALKQEEVHKRFALTHEAAARYAEALEHALLFLDHASQPDEAMRLVFRCANKVTDSRLAVKHLARRTQRHAAHPEVLLPLAMHYHHLNDVASAIRCVDEVRTACPLSVEAHLLAVRWRMESGVELEEAERVLGLAESSGLQSFELHKYGLQLSLRRGDVAAAFRHLDRMTKSTDADLSPLKKRIEALASKMSAL